MPKKLGPFFSLFLMRKRLSSSKKSSLRPYFPLIRGMFVFRSGLRFLFRALEVPEPRMRKRPFSFTKMETWLKGVKEIHTEDMIDEVRDPPSNKHVGGGWSCTL